MEYSTKIGRIYRKNRYKNKENACKFGEEDMERMTVMQKDRLT